MTRSGALPRNRYAERLVDGGRCCAVLPALQNLDALLSARDGIRYDSIDESPRSYTTETLTSRQQQQQRIVERMHRGSVEDVSPTDVASEIRRLTLPPVSREAALKCASQRSKSGGPLSMDGPRHRRLRVAAKQPTELDCCSLPSTARRHFGTHHQLFEAVNSETSWGGHAARPSSPQLRAKLKYSFPKKLPPLRRSLDHDEASEFHVPSETLSSSTKSSSPEPVSPLEPAANGKRIKLEHRHACEGLRMFVFGAVGNEGFSSPKEKNAVFYESMGTREQVVKLHELWGKLDTDESGRVDVAEFKAYLQHPSISNSQRRWGERIVLMFLIRGSFSLEDLMRTIWPASTDADLKCMLAFIEDHAIAQLGHLPAPPVLPLEERQALVKTFEHVASQAGSKKTPKVCGVTLADLVRAGLMDEEEEANYEADWSIGKERQITVEEFLMMMCPAGFRAFENAHIGSTKDGNFMVLEADTGNWCQTDAVHL